MANHEWIKTTEDRQILVNSAKVCDLFGVSDTMLKAWAKQGLQKEERGWWNLKTVIAWRGIARLEGGEASPAAKKLKADADEKYAKARQEEIKLQAMLGNLIDLTMVQAFMTSLFSRVRQMMLALPNEIRVETYTLYPECSTEVTKIAENKVNNCLTELSELYNDRNYQSMAAKPRGRGRPRTKELPTAKKTISK